MAKTYPALPSSILVCALTDRTCARDEISFHERNTAYGDSQGEGVTDHERKTISIGRSQDCFRNVQALPGRERLGTIRAFEGFEDGEDGDGSGGGGGEKKEFAATAGNGRAGAERLDDGGAGAVAVEVVIGAFLG